MSTDRRATIKRCLLLGRNPHQTGATSSVFYFSFTMQYLLLPLMLISGMGFVLSAITHLAALAGQIDAIEIHLPQDALGLFTSVMSLGIFAVWMPAALIAQRINNGNRLHFSWRKVLAGCPAWMRNSAYGLFAYAIVNFFLGIGSGMAESQHGMRLFSGHWMLFYGMAFCIFFSRSNPSTMTSVRHCPGGHEIGHDDAFCPVCGLPAARDDRDG
ncbi:hypothetical protein [uncultured Comamonas sp.]|uniref:hypothetical protein n=1 Tax=uncultured Comamonas sp. TaxID=114710 RepID=UPI0025E70196|nr:hypothetical protein [uncultured Comamonas sp.]